MNIQAIFNVVGVMLILLSGLLLAPLGVSFTTATSLSKVISQKLLHSALPVLFVF